MLSRWVSLQIARPHSCRDHFRRWIYHKKCCLNKHSVSDLIRVR
jgi:hypothetical protein